MNDFFRSWRKIVLLGGSSRSSSTAFSSHSKNISKFLMASVLRATRYYTTYTKYSTLVWEDSHWSVANFGSKIHFSAHSGSIAFLHTTTKQKNSICIKSVQIGSFQKILAHILLKMNFRSTPNGLVMVPIIHLFLR